MNWPGPGWGVGAGCLPGVWPGARAAIPGSEQVSEEMSEERGETPSGAGAVGQARGKVTPPPPPFAHRHFPGAGPGRLLSAWPRVSLRALQACPSIWWALGGAWQEERVGRQTRQPGLGRRGTEGPAVKGLLSVSSRGLGWRRQEPKAWWGCPRLPFPHARGHLHRLHTRVRRGHLPAQPHLPPRITPRTRSHTT